MRIGVPRETTARERRVALTPAGAAALVAKSHEVTVEVGAGLKAGFPDALYREAGASIDQRAAVIGTEGMIVQVHGPGGRDLESPDWAQLGQDHVMVANHDPLWKPDHAATLAATGATVIALELIPRTTKAQTMDVLSSMATVAGYQAALLGASRLSHMVPMMMTAAGTVPPARFLVLGAGVAGLQAIATARRLGAVVEGYDIRPAATEQIRSLGAKAVSSDGDAEDADGAEDAGGYATEQNLQTTRRQHELLTPHVAEANVVIATAAIPGAVSPELITTAMVEEMTPGSIIIDLATERGGNCRLSRSDEEVTHDGVTILGPTDLPSRAATTSSQMFSNNIVSLLDHLMPEALLSLDLDDEITAGTVVAVKGSVRHPRVAELIDGDNEVTDGQPTDDQVTANAPTEDSP